MLPTEIASLRTLEKLNHTAIRVDHESSHSPRVLGRLLHDAGPYGLRARHRLVQGVDGKTGKGTPACSEFWCLTWGALEHGEVRGAEFRHVVNRSLLMALGFQRQPNGPIEPDDRGQLIAEENQCPNILDHGTTVVAGESRKTYL